MVRYVPLAIAAILFYGAFVQASGAESKNASNDRFKSSSIGRDALASKLSHFAYPPTGKANSKILSRSDQINVEESIRNAFSGRFRVINRSYDRKTNNGFEALAVQDTGDASHAFAGKGDIYVIFVGTNDKYDGSADVDLVVESRFSKRYLKSVWRDFPSAFLDSQIRSAMKFFDDTKRISEGNRMWVIGHSLGGLLAQVVGAVKSVSTISFSAPGAPDSLLYRHGIKVNQSFDMIDYTRSSDIIGTFGDDVGTTVELERKKNAGSWRVRC